ncbi:fibronectin type III domain-containing protein [Sporichthya sp.]|uniref:fibronectin type III domain-containing protein n=1 Tax=Sporichthya sp. TaxID=65475 RepID=UPI0025FE1BEC|nr:fibronectin type III domain-containing protein [Sporichthya sp.]
MKVSWAATDADGDAITGYTLQYSGNAGSSWTSVSLPSPTATSVTVNVGSTTNVFRVRASDARGAVGGYANGPQFAMTLAQQSAATLSLSTNWTTVNHSDASGGSLKQAKAAGSTATFTFNGTQIAWIGTWSPNRGRAEIFFDGVSQGTVDLYGADVSTRRILFSKKVGSGNHTLLIKVLGTKDSRSASSYVDADAFVTVR